MGNIETQRLLDIRYLDSEASEPESNDPVSGVNGIVTIWILTCHRRR